MPLTPQTQVHQPLSTDMPALDAPAKTPQTLTIAAQTPTTENRGVPGSSPGLAIEVAGNQLFWAGRTPLNRALDSNTGHHESGPWCRRNRATSARLLIVRWGSGALRVVRPLLGVRSLSASAVLVVPAGPADKVPHQAGGGSC